MLKYYIYISKSKVDMLIGQIPQVYKKKYAGKIGVNVGIFHATFEASGEQNQTESDSQRLQLVSSYIEETEKVGTLDETELWIKDRLDVKHVQLEGNPALFLLVGKRDRRYYLLGGSSHHVVGNMRPSTVAVSYSYFPYIAGAMESILADEKASVLLYDFQKRMRERLHNHHSSMQMVEGEELSNVTWTLFERSKAEPISVEFLARFLGKARTTEEYPCTISSPLYVNQL